MFVYLLTGRQALVSNSGCVLWCVGTAYSETAGKTFTMEGNQQNPGVNYRALDELFNIVDERSLAWTYELKMGMLEIYNEEVRDLLADPKAGGSRKLDIKQNPEGGTHIPELTIQGIANADEAASCIQGGQRNRSVGRTNIVW